MIAEALLTVALALPVSDDRQVSPSRGTSTRYMDSGHAVWGKTARWIRELSLCIRRHESINAGHYKARNGQSSAAGAYQMLSAHWLGNARWAKWQGRYVARGYRTASAAPAWVQDVVFIHSIKHGGIKAWKGTGCQGTG